MSASFSKEDAILRCRDAEDALPASLVTHVKRLHLQIIAPMPVVFVVSTDWILRTTVRAELREAGIEAIGLESVDDLARMIAQGTAPSAVVLDATQEDLPSHRDSIARLMKRVPVVVVASRVQRQDLANAWLHTAAAILYRPVSVGEIVARVKEFLRGQAA